MTPQSPREFDIVVYGASGFVGRLVAQHLARQAPLEVRIALAGRDEAKIAAVRGTLGGSGATWPILVADAADVRALGAIVTRASVVATTVGPYAKYGLPLVGACAAAGTDYVDLTGEVVFVRKSVDEFHDVAQASGARIVHSCGFDSIPSDLGVYLTWRRAEADGAGALGETTLVMRKAKGGFSGGTIDSLRHQLDTANASREVARLLADPYGLSPDRRSEPPISNSSVDADVSWPHRDNRLGEWVGPFVMAPFNTRIVRRSNALLGHAYGPNFHYQEVVGFGTSPLAPVMAAGMSAGFGGLIAGLQFGPTRMVLDRHRLPDRAGVLTPAVAMGDALTERLRAAGMVLESAPLTVAAILRPLK